jgi:hypothetical protein
LGRAATRTGTDRRKWNQTIFHTKKMDTGDRLAFLSQQTDFLRLTKVFSMYRPVFEEIMCLAVRLRGLSSQLAQIARAAVWRWRLPARIACATDGFVA